MKLVIDIDEDTYNDIMNWSEFNVINIGLKLREIAQNGILLPKGHGDLIDRDNLLNTLEKLEWIRTDCSVDEDNTNILEDIIGEVPTIIEADKGE